MKNVHLLPTDKPSELYINMQGVLSRSNSLLLRLKSRHVYITSDEEIKKGDWCLWLSQNKPIKSEDNSLRDRQDMVKKIILTTDIDLIKDDVQAIDDKFLEWFIKNPNCEFVEVISDVMAPVYYEIIIPKEEPKEREVFLMNANETIDTRSIVEKMKPLQEQWQKDTEEFLSSKQETLEEAAERIYPNHGYEDEAWCDLGEMSRELWLEGAKWQQERSYSFDELRLWLIERDVYLYNYYTTYKKSGIPMENVDKYIEDSHEYLMGRKQFKKK